MNKVIDNKLYRDIRKKKITGEDAYITVAMSLVPLSIVLALTVTGWAWFGLAVVFCMFLLGGTIWYTTPEDYEYKFRSVLNAQTSSGKEVVASLETLLGQYVEELKYICVPDSLFDEVWDQVELANITGANLYEYNKKLRAIKVACEKIRRENQIAGRSASTTVVDLALDAAKEFK